MVNNEDVSDHDMGRDFILYKCINYIKLIWIYLIIQIYIYIYIYILEVYGPYGPDF